MHRIARTYHWSHADILELPACAAFHYAMLAERQRWQDLEDMRQAACFPHYDERGQREYVQQAGTMLAGPGKLLPFDHEWSAEERQAAAQADAELDAELARLKQVGMVVEQPQDQGVLSQMRRVKRER